MVSSEHSAHKGNGNGKAAASKKVTEAFNPATGDKIGEVPLHSVEDLQRAVGEARVAQKVWAQTPVRVRCKVMLKVRDYIVEHAEELAETVCRDNGKVRVDALATEVVATALSIDTYCKKAPGWLRDQPLHGGALLFRVYKWSKLVRVPFGVIGIVSPWNYPFGIPFHEVCKALLAGNAVILKTASQTLMVGKAIETCLRGGGVPEGLFHFINLPGAIAGDALFEAGIDKLFFTGSVPVGKKLMAKAAETLTPVSLELGGNDAMLVCPDADLERASSGAVWAGLSNCGQSCGGVERIYVHKDVYQPFLDLLATKVRALRVGPDSDFNVDLGAMTTRGQMQTVQEHIDDALGKGAVIYAQSEAPKGGGGQFMPATVLTEVNHTMRTMREETFGPVLAVMKVDSMDQAVELANDSDLGLTGSVWSRNQAYAEKLGRRIQAGAITFNDHLMSHGLAETPWGGFKNSGIGRTHGQIGFDEMTEPQVLIKHYLPLVKKDIWWHPHSRQTFDAILGLADMHLSRSVWKRLKGLGWVFKMLPRMLNG
ncbi:MAG: aldehyde dehydrogenase family protein [Pseudomonadota bacterium]